MVFTIYFSHPKQACLPASQPVWLLMLGAAVAIYLMCINKTGADRMSPSRWQH